jgi:sugar phosphate isomerase/epimerase
VKLRSSDACHLTYCSNIHPGESWPEIKANLNRYVPKVKREICADRDFGVGLRVSGIAAEALQQPGNLEELKDLLHDNGLYVFTINGFPYGTFHGRRVKEEVYLPDWRDEERLRYTNLLADLLAELLPENDKLSGSISTVPGAFKPNARSPSDVSRMASLLIRHAAYLVRLRESTGKTIALALEPEPCCFIETIEEAVEFFQTRLHSREAIKTLADLTGEGPEQAEEALRRHLGVCLDLCHAAVEFEDPQAMLDRLDGAGIAVPKMQISAGLRLTEVSDQTRRLLEPFNDDVYLHQVVERTGEQLNRYSDLPQAFERLSDVHADREWRIHFHVPIFMHDLDDFSTTQPFLLEVLKRHRESPISPHLEVETYTWDVLPEFYKECGVEAAIVRELDWVIRILEPATA